jgi:DNA-binding winged helix-turn-helix (wHTH) protein
VRLRFGECVLDTDRRELTRAERPVALSPKAFRLLEVLAERRPNAVAQSDLRRLLWPDALAGGTRLARLAGEVRAAIGDTGGEERVLRTVHRFGYAFVAEAMDEAPPGRAACALQMGAQQVPLAAGENLIGRGASALVSVASSRVSRRHARILVAEGRATLEDLGSKNGTYLGSRRVREPIELKDGDHITIGPVVLVFCSGSDDKTQ